MKEKFNVSDKQYFNINKKILEIRRQLRQKGGSLLNPEFVELALQNIVEGRFDRKVESNPSILRLISSGEKITIDALDGQECICDADDVFNSFISSDFERFGLNGPGLATAETSFDVYEMFEDGTFFDVFTSISNNLKKLEKLVVTQAQIKKFCKKYPNWLSQGGNVTLFLTNKGEKYFVIKVSGSPVGNMGATISRFEDYYLLRGESLHRVVVPRKLKL